MQQYIQAANLPQVMKAVAALEYQQARSQALSSAKALPPAQQAVVLADFDRAFDAAERDKQQKIMSAMADYYARRMSDDELEKAVAFYSSGLGLKVLRDGQHLTPDERQELGRDVLASPALQTFSKLNFDYLRRVAAARAADTAVFQADFRANLCRNLAASHIRSSACVASRP